MGMTLEELARGQIARVTGFQSDDSGLEPKLREIGFAEDDEVEIVHFGPLMARPVCVRLNRTLIALRRNEAAAIEVSIG